MKLIRNSATEEYRMEEKADYAGRQWTYGPLTSTEWKRWLYQTYQNFPVCLSGCRHNLSRTAQRIPAENIPGKSEVQSTLLSAGCRTRVIRIRLSGKTLYFRGVL